MRISRCVPALLVAVAVACHTEPIAPAFYGATGPFTPGSEARLTFNSGDKYHHPFSAYAPSWAAGGAGILYTFSPRPYQVGESLESSCSGSSICGLVSRDRLDTCMALLPPEGGSAYWQLCETRAFHTDSVDIFTAGAVNGAGQLLYVELTGPTNVPLPLGSHAELWLATPDDPAPRRQLMTLYHDRLGVDQTSGVNWLVETQWSSTSMFYAIGQHRTPLDDYTPFGIVRGVITASGASVSVIPGTAGAKHYALVGGGSTILYVDGSASIGRIDVATGAATTAATLALGPGGTTLDISCRPDACVILTGSGGLWKLDVGSGTVTLVRTIAGATTAKLSPVSGDVVALEGVNLYLITGVIP